MDIVGEGDHPHGEAVVGGRSRAAQGDQPCSLRGGGELEPYWLLPKAGKSSSVFELAESAAVELAIIHRLHGASKSIVLGANGV